MARKSKSKTLVANTVAAPEVIETNDGEFSTTIGIETAEPIETSPLETEQRTIDNLELPSPQGWDFVEAGLELPSDSDPAIDAALAEIEASELSSEAEIEAALSAEDQTPEETLSEETLSEETLPEGDLSEDNLEPSFADLMAAVDDEDVLSMGFTIKEALEARETFERAKNPDNETIKRTLKGVRAAFSRPSTARVFVAAGVDVGFINRSKHDGSRYNVYALGKVADLVEGLTQGSLKNAINRACMASLFRCRVAGVSFTGELARASASNKLRVSEAVKKHLLRHTVSASTAPTQASSTMQAAQTLGIVRAEGGERSPTYVVTDNPVAKAMEAIADKIAA